MLQCYTEAYERTALIITASDVEDVITTSVGNNSGGSGDNPPWLDPWEGILPF